MTILYMLQVLIGFGFVIFIHEMGHFLAAKRVGVTCPAFSIGFPFPVWTPKGWKAYNIFRYTWKGTEYRLGWIPFGGYVTMRGQSDNPGQLDAPVAGDPADYRNKTYWQKTQVLLGGVTMNAITAVIGFIIAFQIGVTFIEPTIGMIDQRSQAWIDNEVQVGDRVLSVNGRDVVDFEDVIYAGIFDGGESVDLVIEREVEGAPVRKNVTLGLDKDPVFGIAMPAIRARHRVVLTAEEAALFPENLGGDRPEDGDELVAINGHRIVNVQDAFGQLEVSRGEVELTLRRGVGDDARTWTVRHTPRRKFYTETAAFPAEISTSPPAWVDRIQRGGAAEFAGFRQGDRLIGIVQADGIEQRFTSFGEMNQAIDASAGKTITVLVERDGKPLPITVTPQPRDSRPGRYALGVTVSMVDPRGKDEKQLIAAESEPGKLIAHAIRPGSPLLEQGMKPGDEIVGIKVGGETVTDPTTGTFTPVAFQAALIKAADADAPVEITYEVQRADGVKSFSFTTDANGPGSMGYLSVATAEQRSEPVTYGLLESVTQGFYHSKKQGYKILMTLGGLFTGRVKIWHLGGPVVIAKRSYGLAQWGTGTLVFFLAFISINLAIVNLLPLPVLDGGQWLIVTLEAIRKRPLPERAMGWVQTASFLAVVGLMLFVLGNDLVTVFIRRWV